MPATLLVMALASAAAGAINAMAGGGTFITFPALTAIVGLPEKAANVTSTCGLWAGYAGSIVAARRVLRELGGRTVILYGSVGAIGGAAGAVLLLTTPAGGFAVVVPWLMAFSTALFAVGPRVHGWASRGAASGPEARFPSLPLVGFLLVVAGYCGYFGAGGGVLLLAGMAAAMPGDVRRLTALKVVVQVTANAAAIVVFLSAGIDWAVAGVMSIGSALGGFAGMSVATRVPDRLLRAVILSAGATLSVAYFVKLQG